MVLLGVAELGSLNDDARIAFQGLVPYFGANVLTFSITISPDEQNLRIFGLLSDVICDRLFVLEI